jgi:hypothetical protein
MSVIYCIYPAHTQINLGSWTLILFRKFELELFDFIIFFRFAYFG